MCILSSKNITVTEQYIFLQVRDGPHIFPSGAYASSPSFLPPFLPPSSSSIGGCMATEVRSQGRREGNTFVQQGGGKKGSSPTVCRQGRKAGRGRVSCLLQDKGGAGRRRERGLCSPSIAAGQTLLHSLLLHVTIFPPKRRKTGPVIIAGNSLLLSCT